MENRELYRTALIFAVLATLGWIVWLGGLMGPGQGDLGDVESYLEQVDSALLVLATWGGIIGALFFIPAFLAIYIGFYEEVGSVLSVPIVFAMIGAVFLALGFMVDTGSLIYELGPEVEDATAEDAMLLATIASMAQDSIEVTWFVGSFLEFGAPILWAAWLVRRSNSVPRWVNRAGILGGLAGFIWLIGFVPFLEDFPQFVSFLLVMANIVLTLAWLIALPVILSRSSEQSATSASYQSAKLNPSTIS